MPAHRKPADRRQRDNTDDVGTIVALVPSSGIAKPEPSATWLDSTLDEWHSFWLTPMASPQVLNASDYPALVRLFELRDQWARAQEMIADQPMSKGSTGQLTLSPWAAEAHRIEGAISKLEDRFGLSPIARLRLGVTIEEGVNLAARNAALLEAFRRDQAG